MNQEQIDTMAEALRRQGLTWSQTNFAVSLVRNAVTTERERWERPLGAEMPDDFKCWHQNAASERPEVAAWVIRNLRERELLAWSEGPNARLTAPDTAQRNADE